MGLSIAGIRGWCGAGSYVRSFVDDDLESLRTLSARARKTQRGVLAAVYPHGDGMLNTPQLNILVDELDAELTLRGLTEGEREMCVKLAGAAYETIRRGGYLFFDGD